MAFGLHQCGPQEREPGSRYLLACSEDGEKFFAAAPEGVYRENAWNVSAPARISGAARRRMDGVSLRFRGEPHRCYRLLYGDLLVGCNWCDDGSVDYDSDGSVETFEQKARERAFWRSVNYVYGFEGSASSDELFVNVTVLGEIRESF